MLPEAQEKGGGAGGVGCGFQAAWVLAAPVFLSKE